MRDTGNLAAAPGTLAGARAEPIQTLYTCRSGRRRLDPVAGGDIREARTLPGPGPAVVASAAEVAR